MVVQQQLKLSIEESHSANDGHAQGGGEEHFVEHLFLLASVPGLRQITSSCSCCDKSEWGESRPLHPTGSVPLHCFRSQRKAARNLQTRGAGVNT